MTAQALAQLGLAVFSGVITVERLVVDRDTRIEQVTVGSGDQKQPIRTQDARRLGQERLVVIDVFNTMLFAREPIWNLALRASRFQSRWSNIASELSAMSSTYRQRPGAILMGLVLSVLSHGLTVLVFFLLGKALFGVRMAATLGHHFLMVPLTLLTMAAPLPFGALGLSEEAGSHLLGMVGHPSGAVVMMALRGLMIACGLEGACVCLLGFKELPTLTAAAGDLPTNPALERLVDDQKTPPQPACAGLPARGGP
jgi:hypothetical protein